MRTKELYDKHRVGILERRRINYLNNKVEISARRKELYNPEKQHWINIARKYGLTKDQVEDMQQGQDNRCLICRDILILPRIDHSHVTQKVRGLLCHDCNIGLGNFKDDPRRLIAAAVYLEYESGNLC